MNRRNCLFPLCRSKGARSPNRCGQLGNLSPQSCLFFAKTSQTPDTRNLHSPKLFSLATIGLLSYPDQRLFPFIVFRSENCTSASQSCPIICSKHYRSGFTLSSREGPHTSKHEIVSRTSFWQHVNLGQGIHCILASRHVRDAGSSSRTSHHFWVLSCPKCGSA